MRHHASLILLLIASALTTLWPQGGASAQADLTADQIIERMLKQPFFGWDDAETTVRMGLIDAAGKRSERVMENLRRRKDGLLQSVTRFRAPQDVAGIAFLALERPKGESEQHIYLPGQKRTRRIARSDRDKSFMGSEFTYADMERRDTRESTHKRLPDEDLNGVKTFVLESTPKKDSGSAYSKIESWVRQDNFLPLRIRFYDKDGKLEKTFYTKRIRQLDGHPSIMESQMVNKQTGKTTELIVDDMRPRKDLPDSDFTPTALEHG